MTWGGEDPASGVMIFTEDGSYGSVVGTSGEFLGWGANGAEFLPISNIISVPGASGSIITIDGAGNLIASTANVDSSGTITMPGGQIVNGVITSSVSYNMQQTDWLVISTATTARTIFLPSSPVTWQYHNVKDGAGNANSKKITIDGNGNDIDGDATIIINGKYSAYSFVYNGTEWNVI